ncbi:MAG: hypothetical protein WBY53_19880 [Acidobacteriaceae bacterium]
MLAVNDDASFRRFAWHDWFGVRVIGSGLDLPNVATLNGTRSLFLGIPPAVLDLNESGMSGNLSIKVCLHLGVIAGTVEALVALHVAE